MGKGEIAWRFVTYNIAFVEAIVDGFFSILCWSRIWFQSHSFESTRQERKERGQGWTISHLKNDLDCHWTSDEFQKFTTGSTKRKFTLLIPVAEVDSDPRHWSRHGKSSAFFRNWIRSGVKICCNRTRSHLSFAVVAGVYMWSLLMLFVLWKHCWIMVTSVVIVQTVIM